MNPMCSDGVFGKNGSSKECGPRLSIVLPSRRCTLSYLLSVDILQAEDPEVYQPVKLMDAPSSPTQTKKQIEARTLGSHAEFFPPLQCAGYIPPGQTYPATWPSVTRFCRLFLCIPLLPEPTAPALITHPHLLQKSPWP